MKRPMCKTLEENHPRLMVNIHKKHSLTIIPSSQDCPDF